MHTEVIRYEMPVIKIKICGITNLGDAQAAVEAGADALGFMFYEGSPRFVTFAQAAEMIHALPPFIAKVGVFVNSPAEFIQQAIDQCGLDTLQLHGDESPEFCSQFNLKVLKAFRLHNEDSLRPLAAYATSAWLLDTYFPGQAGGTGASFDWRLAVAAKMLGRPIVLAGGLNPDNVAQAIREVQPYGVDVSSGVETAPGRKDRQKLRDFVAAARHP